MSTTDIDQYNQSMSRNNLSGSNNSILIKQPSIQESVNLPTNTNSRYPTMENQNRSLLQKKIDNSNLNFQFSRIDLAQPQNDGVAYKVSYLSPTLSSTSNPGKFQGPGTVISPQARNKPDLERTL